VAYATAAAARYRQGGWRHAATCRRSSRMPRLRTMPAWWPVIAMADASMRPELLGVEMG